MCKYWRFIIYIGVYGIRTRHFPPVSKKTGVSVIPYKDKERQLGNQK